jgi:tight adherence protein C
MDSGAPSAATGPLLVDAGSALAAMGVFLAVSAMAVRRRLAKTGRLVPSLPTGSRDSRSFQGSLLSMLGRIGRTRLAGRFRHRGRLRRRLELAGDPVSLEAMIGLKLSAAIGGAAPLLLMGAMSRSAMLAAIPAGLAASRAPDLLVARRGRRRQLRISAGVPDLAELLVATTGAGLNPPLAFRRSAEILDGPLGEELRVAVRRLELGTPWRTALEELAERTADPSIHRLVRAMARSQRLGTPLASALSSVAQDLRNERRTRAEELARRAPVKMLFPLVFLILPAFLLLTVGPVLLATIRTLH